MPWTFGDAGEPEFERLKALVLHVGTHGEFTASDVLARASISESTRPSGATNAGDVDGILDDLQDLGYIHALPGSNPPRWRLA
jgi:hypothetical protein